MLLLSFFSVKMILFSPSLSSFQIRHFYGLLWTIWTTPFDFINKQREGQATFGLPTSAIIVVSVNFRVFLCKNLPDVFFVSYLVMEYGFCFTIAWLFCFVFFFVLCHPWVLQVFTIWGEPKFNTMKGLSFWTHPPPCPCPSTPAIGAPAHSPLAHQTSTHAIRQWGHKGRRRKE